MSAEHAAEVGGVPALEGDSGSHTPPRKFNYLEAKRQGSMTNYSRALGNEGEKKVSSQPISTPLAEDPRARLRARLKAQLATYASDAAAGSADVPSM